MATLKTNALWMITIQPALLTVLQLLMESQQLLENHPQVWVLLLTNCTQPLIPALIALPAFLYSTLAYNLLKQSRSSSTKSLWLAASPFLSLFYSLCKSEDSTREEILHKLSGIWPPSLLATTRSSGRSWRKPTAIGMITSTKSQEVTSKKELLQPTLWRFT